MIRSSPTTTRSSPSLPSPVGVTDKERKVYNLIYRKFVGAFMDPHDYEATTAITACGTYDFQSKGKREINLGWRELYTTDKQNADDQALPALAKGDQVTKVKVLCEGRETKPPAAYTEASLLKKMEVLGLGTPQRGRPLSKPLRRRTDTTYRSRAAPCSLRRRAANLSTSSRDPMSRLPK